MNNEYSTTGDNVNLLSSASSVLFYYKEVLKGIEGCFKKYYMHSCHYTYHEVYMHACKIKSCFGDQVTTSRLLCKPTPSLHLVIIPVAELTFRAERLSDRRGS